MSKNEEFRVIHLSHPELFFVALVAVVTAGPKEPLPNITLHSLRHTFCTRMSNGGGVDI